MQLLHSNLGLKNFLPWLNLESLKPFLLSDNSDEKMENYIIYIAGGVVGVLLLFCVIVFLFLVKFELCLISCCNCLSTNLNKVHLVILSLYILNILKILFCVLNQRIRRERKSENRSEETHVYMKLLHRQALPDPQTDHPPSSQPDVYTIEVIRRQGFASN